LVDDSLRPHDYKGSYRSFAVSAPSAFLLAQAAVVTTSVVLLQMDWGSQTKEVRKPQPVLKSAGHAPVVAAVPVPPVALAAAKPAKTEEPPPPPADAFELTPEEPALAVPLEDPFPKPNTSIAGAYDIAADAASNFDLKNERVVFTGHVSLKSKRFTVKADRLTVSIDPKENEMRHLLAHGNVHVEVNSEEKDGGYTGQAWEANFDPNTNIITLTGWPRIQGGGREHRALEPTTKMMLTTEKPRLTTQGRASTLITALKTPGTATKP